MDDRGYVAQALFDRLRSQGVPFRVLGDSRGFPEHAAAEIEMAVPRAALGAMPRSLARFCQDFDLQLAQLARLELRAWSCVVSWSDDIGRPRFLGARILSDYYRGARRLLRADELLAPGPEALFAYALLEGVELQFLDEEWLTHLWHENPRAAIERVRRYWPRTADIRLVARAARDGDWSAVRSSLPRLRRGLHRAVLPRPDAAAARLALLARRALHPARAAVAFTGREDALRGAVLGEVERDLAPLGLALFEDVAGKARRADFRVVFDAPGILARERDDVLALPRELGLPAMVAEADRAILRWLACRVERRFPDAVVGENPRSARLLQFACRTELPVLRGLLGLVMNCEIACRIRSPILMPYPYGIVIERGAVIGSRVTVMQQASLLGAPVIEDNVCIGPGARIIGEVRIGRGATVGANAVVTRDVPSHCTVVGANRILGRAQGLPVVPERLEDQEIVVNT